MRGLIEGLIHYDSVLRLLEWDVTQRYFRLVAVPDLTVVTFAPIPWPLHDWVPTLWPESTEGLKTSPIREALAQEANIDRLLQSMEESEPVDMTSRWELLAADGDAFDVSGSDD